MADLSYLKNLNQPIAILGLGITGSAVAKACRDNNIAAHLWDDNETTRQKYSNDGFDILDFRDDLSGYALLIPAAGIKPDHAVIKQAHAQNITIKSDIDLLYQSAPDATYIGITGTNGKSTTTALIAHILKSLGKECAMGGNIGVAAASLPSFDKNGIYVLEMSSYQLEITTQPIFDIAICLNITSDHLAWHGTMANYITAKEKIFAHKDNKQQTAIIGIDTQASAEIIKKLNNKKTHHVIEISGYRDLPDNIQAPATLQGAHNRQNIAAAYAVCKTLNITKDAFQNALNSFDGLVHRQQIVSTLNGVTFINDSKATNATATATALGTFNNIHWIVGGDDKDDGLDGLDAFYPRIKHAYLIGKSSDRFEQDLQNTLATTRCNTMDKAVAQAFKNAENGDIVLLSPACASFDQYANFEKRGEDFITLVEQLKESQPS